MYHSTILSDDNAIFFYIHFLCFDCDIYKLVSWLLLWNCSHTEKHEDYFIIGSAITFSCLSVLPVVPHKAVAEVSKIGNL